MEIIPFQHETQRTLWKSPADDTGLDIDDDLIIAIYRMKMRRCMVAGKNADGNPKKS